MKPESKIIKRNEGLHNFSCSVQCDISQLCICVDTNSKRGKEIEEVLRHEPGALCSLLEIFLEAEVSARCNSKLF